MLRNNNGKMYYVSAHYDVIYYIHHRRKRHFEDIGDNYKVINDVITCNDIVLFSVICLKHICLIIENMRIKCI